MAAVDSHRQALRAGAPWLVLALGALFAAHGTPALLGPLSSNPPAWTERAASLVGLIGSAAMLIGLMQLARARVAGRRHPALALAFGAWVAEFVARLAPLNGSSSGPKLWIAIQLVSSSAAMWFAASGVAWILRAQQAGGAVAPWRRAKRAFAALTLATCALVAISAALGPEADLAQRLHSVPLGPALAWLAFAAPWLLLALAVRSSLRWLGRVRSTAEILAR